MDSFQHPASMSTDNKHAQSLVVCSLAQLDEPHFLASIIQSATRSTRNHLVILLFSSLFDDHWRCHEVQKLLTWIYVQSTAVAQEMDKVLMEVDVLLRGNGSREALDLREREFDAFYRFENDTNIPDLPWEISQLPTTLLTRPSIIDKQNSIDADPTCAERDLSFPVVAVGGTFDHLHAGHKILLSMSAWIATQKLIVGVTVDKLLVNKSNKHVLESFDERISHVRSFLTLFKPSLELSIVPIDDVYGPTGWDPNIQALVVSKETLSGGAAIDKLRKEKSLPSLETFVIDVISANEILDTDDPERLKRAKVSSTFIREWIAKSKAEEKN